MADDKDKKIGEVPHLENVTGNEKIPVSAKGEPRYIEVKQIGPTLQEGVKGTEKNYIFSDPTIQGKGAIAAARYRANEKGRLTAQYKYWGDSDFNYNTEFPQATENADGVMSAADKKKLEDVKELADTLNEGLGLLEKDAATKEELSAVEKQKADVGDLSNVLGEEVIDGSLLEEIEELTREEIKKDLFIDLWNNACGSYGRYNKETGYFELNGILDIEYDEALEIYNNWYYKKTAPGMSLDGAGINVNARTLLPFFSSSNYPDSAKIICNGNRVVEVLHFSQSPNSINSLPVTNVSYSLAGCLNLRIVDGALGIGQITTFSGFLQNTFNIEKIHLDELKVNIDVFKDKPKLQYESVDYLIKKAKNTAPITVKVHQDIYNALIGENTEYPFNGGTQEEWTQLAQDAIAKQITFATA